MLMQQSEETSWKSQAAVSWSRWSGEGFLSALLKVIQRSAADWLSATIKMERFQKRRAHSPCCFSSAPVLHLTPRVFAFALADGDGVQDHLLPVCEDEACQRSAIYLAKSGSTEVLDACVVNLLTCTFFSLPRLSSVFALLSNLSSSYICCSLVLTSLSSS